MPALSPQDVHRLFLDAFNRGDVDALVALYEPSALLVTGDGPAAGHAAIHKAYERMVAGAPHMTLATASVLESHDGLAVLHAHWTYLRDGQSVSGLSTEVVRRQPDGSWRFLFDEPRTPGTARP